MAIFNIKGLRSIFFAYKQIKDEGSKNVFADKNNNLFFIND